MQIWDGQLTLIVFYGILYVLDTSPFINPQKTAQKLKNIYIKKEM